MRLERLVIDAMRLKLEGEEVDEHAATSNAESRICSSVSDALHTRSSSKSPTRKLFACSCQSSDPPTVSAGKPAWFCDLQIAPGPPHEPSALFRPSTKSDATACCRLLVTPGTKEGLGVKRTGEIVGAEGAERRRGAFDVGAEAALRSGAANLPSSHLSRVHAPDHRLSACSARRVELDEQLNGEGRTVERLRPPCRSQQRSSVEPRVVSLPRIPTASSGGSSSHREPEKDKQD
eukprot:747235-Hanusia_phi.AAC.2